MGQKYAVFSLYVGEKTLKINLLDVTLHRLKEKKTKDN